MYVASSTNSSTRSNKVAKVQYEYKIIDCHEQRDQTGIHDKVALLTYILNTIALQNNGWRFHSLVNSDAFGIKSACPLVILEREIK